MLFKWRWEAHVVNLNTADVMIKKERGHLERGNSPFYRVA